jgi:hypothetical protein
MGYTLTTKSYTAIYEELEECLRWLSGIGVEYFNTRIQKYKRDVNELIDTYNSGSINSPINPDWFSKMVNSLYETGRLINIHQGLKDFIISDELKQKIRIFIKGPEFASSEKPTAGSQIPRDIAFELLMASVFNRAQFKIDFHTEADLRATFGNETLYLECKRPRAGHSVHSNVKHAASQLRRRYKTSENSDSVSGIIALSIDKIIYPTDGMLVANSEDVLDKRISGEAESFVYNYGGNWNRIPEAQTIGVIVLIQTIAVIENQKMLTNCNFLGANHIVPSDSSRGQMFTSIIGSIRPIILGNLGGNLTSRSS